MYNRYWFFDSVPTKDLGITKKDIVSDEEKYYVIGGIEGDLIDLIELYDELGLTKNTVGRKFVKSEENLISANKIFAKYIYLKKIKVLGTVFYHCEIPEIIRNKPDCYVANDNPNEKGIDGLRGRAFAQTIWDIMEPLKQIPEINPIVCLDNENKAIQDCVKYHFYKQLKVKKPNAKVKVQSVDLASQNEPRGHILCGVITSIIGNYINCPEKFQITSDLIGETIKFDSKLWLISFDGSILKARYETGPVSNWKVLG